MVELLLGYGCVPFGESKNGFLILDLPDFAVERYEGISMTKFNNLKVERFKSNLKYTESKLVKKTTVKGRKTKRATII